MDAQVVGAEDKGSGRRGEREIDKIQNIPPSPGHPFSPSPIPPLSPSPSHPLTPSSSGVGVMLSQTPVEVYDNSGATMSVIITTLSDIKACHGVRNVYSYF